MYAHFIKGYGGMFFSIIEIVIYMYVSQWLSFTIFFVIKDITCILSKQSSWQIWQVKNRSFSFTDAHTALWMHTNGLHKLCWLTSQKSQICWDKNLRFYFCFFQESVLITGKSEFNISELCRVNSQYHKQTK